MVQQVVKERPEIDPYLYVTVRCGYCGALKCFFPRRVMFLGECECGNDNWGSPGRWYEDYFGDFDLVWKEIWELPQLPGLGGL